MLLPSFTAQTINIPSLEYYTHIGQWRKSVIPGLCLSDYLRLLSNLLLSQLARSQGGGPSVENSLLRAIKAVAGCHFLLPLTSPARKTWQRFRVSAGKPHGRCHNVVVFMLLPNHSTFFRCKFVPIALLAEEQRHQRSTAVTDGASEDPSCRFVNQSEMQSYVKGWSDSSLA